MDKRRRFWYIPIKSPASRLPELNRERYGAERFIMWRASVIMPTTGETLVYTAVYVRTGRPMSLVIEVADTPIIVATDCAVETDSSVQCTAEKLQHLRRCLSDHLVLGRAEPLDLVEQLF